MNAQVALGAFTSFGNELPDGPSKITVSGIFNGWGDGAQMTNNPAEIGSLSNIFSAGKWLRKAVDQDNAAAQSTLGWMYAEGVGVKMDPEQAVLLFRKAANQRYASAQHQLGVMCEKGQGLPQDYQEAARLHRAAAEHDYGGAQNNLAILFAQGQGVPKDFVEAYVWFALAEKHGDKNGAELRASMIREMKPEQIAEAEKRVKEFVPKP